MISYSIIVGIPYISRELDVVIILGLFNFWGCPR